VRYNKGENNPNYKDGRTSKVYYCISSFCNNIISYYTWKYGNKRCQSCGKIKNITNLNKITKNILFNEYIENKKTCKKIGEENKVNPRSISKLLKIYNIRKHLFKELYSKENNPFFGKHHTDKFKKRLSLINGGTGIPYENSDYPPEFNKNLKEAIRQRDNYICQICGCSQLENGRCLDVHHINYDKKNNNPNNLISLCHPCHMKTNKNRKYWREQCQVLNQ